MKKYFILFLILVGFTFNVHAQTAIDPLTEVYYRFDKSLQQNKHYFEVINRSPKTVTFQSQGDANYFTQNDGTVMTLAESGSDVGNAAVVINPGEKKTIAFYMTPEDFQQTKTITFTGAMDGKTFLVNYNVLTTDITVDEKTQ